MAKKKKKKNIVVTGDMLLYQPLSLAVSGYEATAMQQNVIIAILRKLRNCIKAIRDNQFSQSPQQLTLFSDVAGVDKFYQEVDNSYRFQVHLGELGIEPKHYQRAYQTILNTSDVQVYVPEVVDGQKKMRRVKLFDTSTDVSALNEKGEIVHRYKDRQPSVDIIISDLVINSVFSTNSRVYDFIEDTAMMIMDKFPKRVYMYLSTRKNMKQFKIDYWQFRHDIGINDKDVDIDPKTNQPKIIYPVYNAFVKRVLEPSRLKLKELCEIRQCDFYFDYKPIYKGTKRAKHPDELEFTFYISDLGAEIRADKERVQEDIDLENTLRCELNQTKSQITIIMGRLTPANRKLFMDKIQLLIQAKNPSIKNLRSWANRSITLFLDELDSQEDLQFVDADIIEEAETESSVDPALSDKDHILSAECIEKWDMLMKGIQERVSEVDFQTWFAFLELVGEEPKQLLVKIPNGTFGGIVIEKFGSLIGEELLKNFGSGYQLSWILDN